MSLNATLVFVPDAPLPALHGSPTSFDEVTTTAAARFGSHAVFVGDEARELDLPGGSVIVTIGGTADVFVVEVPSEGRLRVYSEGEVVEDEGTALAEETVFNEIADPEDAHIELVCRLAGITPSQLWDAEWFALER